MNLHIFLLPVVHCRTPYNCASYLLGHSGHIVPRGFQGSLGQSSRTSSDSNAQFECADVLDGNIKAPWPLCSNYRLVRYCFADEQTRAKRYCNLQKVVPLYFYEIKEDGDPGGPPMACSKNRKYKPNTLERGWSLW